MWRNARNAGLFVLAVLALGSARVAFVRASAKAELETEVAGKPKGLRQDRSLPAPSKIFERLQPARNIAR